MNATLTSVVVSREEVSEASFAMIQEVLVNRESVQGDDEEPEEQQHQQQQQQQQM